MISAQDIDQLAHARHADPFGVLGMHADASGALWVAAVIPQARLVELVDAASGKVLCEMPRQHKAGVFAGRIPRRRQRFDYRLRCLWADGSDGVYADAFSFPPLISDADLHYLAEGTHVRPYQVLGAHPLALGEGDSRVEGVRFAVWAPNARRVSVVGTFNDWDGRRHPMRHRGGSGVWELFVPHATFGDAYKFELTDGEGSLLPLKADPFAFAAQMRPDNASIVSGLPAPAPLAPQRHSANQRSAAVAIYEVHLASWRRHPDGRFYSWADLAQSLPAHAAGLGFTHVELLPVSEHPFDGSWGYQTLGMFAPTARFGPPEGFASFVRACHNAGLGVIVDWVPAHFPTDAHGLGHFDGTALYEYSDPREGFHRDWNTLIYNFGRTEVRNFLLGSALFWLERYGVDGLRVDAVASMLYRDYSRPPGEWIPNAHGGRENLEAISLFKRMNELLGSEAPGTATIAEESTAFPGVSAPTYGGGLGFHFKWNMGWMHDTLQYMQEEPIHRRWHHDKMTFGLVYAFSENFVLPLSHDEVVHGKRSLLGRMPGDEWQRFANLRAYYGFMWGHPGKKLLFMGQEFAQPTEWNHDAELPWSLMADAKHDGVARLIRELNLAYRNLPALHAQDCDARGFEWLTASDRDNSVFAWVRRDGKGNEVIVVSNFTPVPRTAYRLGIPDGSAARWREAINTDAPLFGGAGHVHNQPFVASEATPSHGRTRSVLLHLPPLATLFLVPA